MQATLKDGRVVRMRIQHNHTDKTELQQALANGERKPVAFTEAKIQIGDTEFTGVSKCHVNDKFTRRRGVTTSVTRALANSGLSRADRTEIWNKIWSGKYSKVNS